MKKRSLFTSLVLTLVLVVLLPASALAASPNVPFNAQGTMDTITVSNEFPAGKSGRFVVTERSVLGTLGEDSSIAGPFVLTYKANVELATQAGNLHGTITTGDYVFKMNGVIQPWIPTPQGLMLTITGHWTIIEGARGQGDFTAHFYFVPTDQYHVAFGGGDFSMSGKWQP